MGMLSEQCLEFDCRNKYKVPLRNGLSGSIGEGRTRVTVRSESDG